jgi:CheY-like chemotaxis protein
MQGDEEKARSAGCDGYIPKPIDTRRFLGNIQKFIK